MATYSDAAPLAFGRDPQARLPGACVQFLRVDGMEITDPIRNAECFHSGGQFLSPRRCTCVPGVRARHQQS